MAEVSLLKDVRVIESSLLSPSGTGQQLADLGAEVIKVEAPGAGDYVRTLTCPVIDSNSLKHWRWNRGKRSIALDLRRPEGVEVLAESSYDSAQIAALRRPSARPCRVRNSWPGTSRGRRAP